MGSYPTPITHDKFAAITTIEPTEQTQEALGDAPSYVDTFRFFWQNKVGTSSFLTDLLWTAEGITTFDGFTKIKKCPTSRPINADA